MRITVEIDEKRLREVCKFTGIEKKSPAVAAAVDGFIRQEQREAFLKKVLEGGTDYRASNEEIEASSAWDGLEKAGS
ncbi:MAG: type II toxin-antitoxin system VapB family antitoxin [Verrucomicrobiota bacterium]